MAKEVWDRLCWGGLAQSRYNIRTQRRRVPSTRSPETLSQRMELTGVSSWN